MRGRGDIGSAARGHALSFREVALVMLADLDAADEQVERDASRLRKRVQTVKAPLQKRLSELSPSDDTPR